MSAVLRLADYRRPDAQAETPAPKPRTEGGYLAIPTDMALAMVRARLTAWEQNTLMTIALKTLGYNKAVDDVTVSQLARMTVEDGEDFEEARTRMSRAFNSLVSRGIISATKGKHGYLVSINPPDQWVKKSADGGVCEKRTVVRKSHVQPCEKRTHNIQPQYTTTTPPVSPQTKKVPRRGSKVLMSTWLEAIHAAGEKAIPADDTIIDYANEAKIPKEFLGLCWKVFKAKYTDPSCKKTYVDWRATFRNCVRENWFGLWYFDKASGECMLTTTGTQAANFWRGK